MYWNLLPDRSKLKWECSFIFVAIVVVRHLMLYWGGRCWVVAATEGTWGCYWLTTILDGLLSGNAIVGCRMTVLLCSFPTTPPPSLSPCWFISRGNIGTIMVIWDVHSSGYRKMPVVIWTVVCVQAAIVTWRLRWRTSPSCAASRAVWKFAWIVVRRLCLIFCWYCTKFSQ